MAHTVDTAEPSFVIPAPGERIANLRPQTARVVEALLRFYATQKVDPSEFGDGRTIGILELAAPWVTRGDATGMLSTYSDYVATLGDLIQVFGGSRDDVLVAQPAREPTIFEHMLGRAPAAAPAQLHVLLRRETYDSARRSAHARDVLA